MTSVGSGRLPPAAALDRQTRRARPAYLRHAEFPDGILATAVPTPQTSRPSLSSYRQLDIAFLSKSVIGLARGNANKN